MLLLNAIPLVKESAAPHFPLQQQPFRTSIAKVVTVNNLFRFEISETEESSCHWLNAFVEVRLRKIGNPLETSDMLEV